MHEINVVRSMLKTVEEFCRQNDINHVDEIEVDIGELSLIIPEYVEELYPACTADTQFKDTRLIINVIPGLAECDDCDEIFNVIENKGYCPNCGSFNKSVLSGESFTIKELHIGEPCDAPQAE